MTYLLQNELLALFAVISAGLLLGRVNIAGLTLGSSGVIFSPQPRRHR